MQDDDLKIFELLKPISELSDLHNGARGSVIVTQHDLSKVQMFVYKRLSEFLGSYCRRRLGTSFCSDGRNSEIFRCSKKLSIVLDMKQLGGRNRLQITPAYMMLEIRVKRVLPATRLCMILYVIYVVGAIVLYYHLAHHLFFDGNTHPRLILVLLFLGAAVAMVPSYLVSEWESTKHTCIFEDSEVGELEHELNKELRSALDLSGDDQKPIR